MTTLLPKILLIIVLVWTVTPAMAGDKAIATNQPAQTVLITGANRGIGLEFARQFAGVPGVS